MRSQVHTIEVNCSVGQCPEVAWSGRVPNQRVACACYCFSLFQQTPTRERNLGQSLQRDVKPRARVTAAE